MALWRDRVKPDIPKNYAAMISVAQRQLIDQQERIRHVEQKIAETRAELNEYSANPRNYTTKHYGSKMGVDDYPPTTRIARLKDYLAEKLARRPLRALEYWEAVENLRMVERRIFEEVTAMGTSKGCVPWPDFVPDFFGFDAVLYMNDESRRKAAEIRRKEQAAVVDEGLPKTMIELTERRHHIVTQGADIPSVTSLITEKLFLPNGLIIFVRAKSYNDVTRLKQLIDEDGSGIIVRDLWRLVTAFIVTGCDWIGYEAWRHDLCSRIPPDVGVSKYRMTRVYDRYEDGSNAVIAQRLQSHLSRTYLPEDTINPTSLIFGSVAKPSGLKDFFSALGFSDQQLENWFMKTQPHTGLFRFNPYSEDTLVALCNSGQIGTGLDIDLQEVLPLFSHADLRTAIQAMGHSAPKRVLDSRAMLLEMDHESVKQVLKPFGLEKTYAVLPPLSLSWTELQGWRMQIRTMAGLLVDLLRDALPHEAKRILLTEISVQ